MLLAAKGMDDRRLERRGKRHDLVMRARAARTAQHRHRLRRIEQGGEFRDLVRVRQQARRRNRCEMGRRTPRHLQQRDVAGHDEHGHAALADRGPHRAVEQFGHLRRIGHHLAEMAAFAEQLGRMRLLEIIEADLGRRDMARDRQHRHPIAVAVEQAVDEVKVARAAAARAHRQFAGRGRLGPGGEGPRLFMTDMHPVDRAQSTQTVVDRVEAISRDAPNPLYAGVGEGRGDQIGDRSCHRKVLW